MTEDEFNRMLESNGVKLPDPENEQLQANIRRIVSYFNQVTEIVGTLRRNALDMGLPDTIADAMAVQAFYIMTGGVA